ncbi:MAG TPA: RraA family protein, partial [Acidobacteriota bacterium]|nr:RraA family protein [Acidobacteriota bacterium]
CDVGVDVEVSGLKVQMGDLLHGDMNGLLKIPMEIAPQVPQQVERVRQREREIMDFVRSPGFSVKRLRELQEKYEH